MNFHDNINNLKFYILFFPFQAKLLQNSQAWLNATPTSSLNSMSGNIVIKLIYNVHSLIHFFFKVNFYYWMTWSNNNINRIRLWFEGLTHTQRMILVPMFKSKNISELNKKHSLETAVNFQIKLQFCVIFLRLWIEYVCCVIV